MKMSKQVAKTAAITIILLMASVMLMAIPEPVKAQTQLPPGVTPTNLQEGGSLPLPSGVTPDETIETKAHLSFTPNPVGLNQWILVNVWLQPPVHVSRYLKGFKIIFTKPDGSTDTKVIDSYQGDSSAWLQYTVDQPGTWKIKFEFPGGYFPPGNYTVPATSFMGAATYSFTKSVYYKPSSDGPYNFTVQTEQVLSWPPAPLPTDYWTRPISPENREWWVIAGNCPFNGRGGGPYWPANTNTYMSNYKFTPWVQGPNSAHIVWKKQGSVLAGITGLAGQWAKPVSYDEAFDTATGAYGAGPGANGNPAILFQGKLYGKVLSVFGGKPMYVWRCTDVRTGEVYWEQPWTSQMPTIISSTLFSEAGAGYVEGAGQRADRLRVNLVYLGGGRLIKYSPTNGGVQLNISIPVTTGTVYADPYVLSVQSLGGGKYRLINWTMEGSTTDFKSRVMGNKSWPFSSLGTVDYEAAVAVFTQGITSPAAGVAVEARIIAVSLKNGEVLWNITSGVGYGIYSGSTAIADHGKFAVRFNDGYYHCWDLKTGSKLWKSESTNWPWDTFAAYWASSAYGFLYDNTYAGIRAIDWNNGKVAWIFKAPTPYAYETPYTDAPGGSGVYPFFSGCIIADGKIYAYNLEHSPTAPFTRGYRLFCINATTGKGIWNITGSMAPGVVADGYLTACNWYDGYMYVFGKGRSQTTVSGPDVVVSKGTGVMIKGSVLDMSPAQPGTPCVAKESMTVWMEYLHMQKPCPSDVKGVPVTLTAIKSDGKVIDLGTVTTNGFYGTFGFAWTPEEEGTYTIVASFMGDDSYGSSSAATLITVGPAPPEPEQPQMPEIPAYTTIDLAIMVMVIIAIVIGIVNLYALRKRK